MIVKKILVPVRGRGVDDDALKLACTVAQKPKAKLYVLYIIEVARDLPLDAHVDEEMGKAEEVLTHAEDIAADIGYDIDTDLIQSRDIGSAIVDEVVQRNVDLVVMGIGYRNPRGKFDLGDIIPYVLKESPCQVLVYRGYKPAE
ncbi:MAG: universal stress protein [Chloroflexota bacterium]|nr:universal stress protein [Chloroflexota bacterium]